MRECSVDILEIKLLGHEQLTAVADKLRGNKIQGTTKAAMVEILIGPVTFYCVTCTPRCPVQVEAGMLADPPGETSRADRPNFCMSQAA
jgi:hypothetical protein